MGLLACYVCVFLDADRRSWELKDVYLRECFLKLLEPARSAPGEGGGEGLGPGPGTRPCSTASGFQH